MTSTPADILTVDPGHADVGVPRPEYPRPDRDRSSRWSTLNGVWDFDADGQSRPIIVPFAWESEASGVHRTWLEHAVYRRRIVPPAQWADARIVLCFGAVHHRAIIRIDGIVVGDHTGGYEYFEIDVTGLVTAGGESELSVEVFAPADKREIPHGKQRSLPRDDYDGVSFTPTSGIWQSVWLEARGRTYAATVALRGESLTGFDASVALTGDAPAGAEVTLRVIGGEEEVTAVADERGRVDARIDVRHPRTWSPEDPHLYEIEVSVRADGSTDTLVVTSGLRAIETRGEHLFLNGERLYVRGVLDQGYWPDTGLTAPTAHALRHELTLARELGYNLVRKHLKFEEPLWLHEADRTGMLVWAEPACPSRYSPASAAAFEAQLEGMVERDGNHPSIVIWGLYNEEWGLDWDIPGSPARAEVAAHAYDRLRSLDTTRPIVENSGWSHVRTDLVDWHYYEPSIERWGRAVADLASGARESFPVRLGPDFVVDKGLYGSSDFPRSGVPLLNSEYGEGFTSLERAWHLRWETQELRRHDRFAGYVYTEFADVEHEAAGLLAHDRREKDWGGCVPADVNGETVLVLDLVPLSAGADILPPSAAFDLDVRVSHHGSVPLTGSVHATWIPAGAPLDSAEETDAESGAVTALPFTLSEPVTVRIPPVHGPARVVLRLVDDDGHTRARSYLDAGAVERPNRRGARPGEFVDWPSPTISEG